MANTRELVSRVARSRPASAQRCSSASSLRGRSAGSQMMLRWSAKRAASPKVFFSPPPPSMIGRSSRSRGSLIAFSARYQVPSRLGRWPRSIGAMICSASSSRLNRSVKVPNSNPSCRCSSSNQPAPMPSTARPPLTTSSVVTALASSVGLPVGVAGDEGGELDALGRGGQRAERGVGLEHRLVGRPDAGQLVEVVHHQHGVETGGLGLAGLRDHRREQLGDRAAVAEVRDLVADANTHAHTLGRRAGRPRPRRIRPVCRAARGARRSRS